MWRYLYLRRLENSFSTHLTKSTLHAKREKILRNKKIACRKSCIIEFYLRTFSASDSERKHTKNRTYYKYMYTRSGSAVICMTFFIRETMSV
jgi:hypothetical protein